MYFELIRNCLHGSTICTYKINKGNSEYYLKSSTEINGMNDLHVEHKGWEWYSKNCSFIEEDCFELITKNNSYTRLIIKSFPGKKSNYRNGLIRNKKVIYSAIDHYLNVWNKNSSKVAMHGDYSLDNIIINQNRIILIDWEHFNDNSTFWGFDIYYLIYETLWFAWNNKLFNKTNQLLAASAFIKYINKSSADSLSNYYHSLREIINFINNNFYLWSKQLEKYPKKLPLLQFKEHDIKYIDRIIKSNLD